MNTFTNSIGGGRISNTSTKLKVDESTTLPVVVVVSPPHQSPRCGV